MKNYKEMAESVLERRNQYLIQKRKRIRNITAAASCLCVCTLMGVIVWQSDVLTNKIPENSAIPGTDIDNTDTIGTGAIGADAIHTEAIGNVPTDSDTDSIVVEGSNSVQKEKEELSGTLPENNSTEPHATETPAISVDIGTSPLAPIQVKLTEDEIYEKIGQYLPPAPPEGYTLESAYLTDSGYYVRWNKGMEELSWRIRPYTEADIAYITAVADTKNYDLTLYPIPRAESVPPELFQIVNNPIFRAEELTLEAVNARAYMVKDAGDCDGYRMDFSVLYNNQVISVTSKGVAPEWLYEQLSFLFQVHDTPLQMEAGDTGNLKPYEEVWGGCYMNEQGNWVVLLTEDTPENRAEVFKKNPGISQSSTEFKKADYSLAYLTQLLADISKAMGNGQLTGVSSAAVYEDANRVKVWITVESDDLTGKILAFDTIGGAVEIIYSPGNTIETMKEVMKGPEI